MHFTDFRSHYINDKSCGVSITVTILENKEVPKKFEFKDINNVELKSNHRDRIIDIIEKTIDSYLSYEINCNDINVDDNSPFVENVECYVEISPMYDE